jgi:tRNA-binding EMAP/Myf-like protein
VSGKGWETKKHYKLISSHTTHHIYTTLTHNIRQMLGKRLIVVCNLKPRNLVGFKSHGMVLCASQEKGDGQTLVEFVDPPADRCVCVFLFPCYPFFVFLLELGECGRFGKFEFDHREAESLSIIPFSEI